MSDPIRVDAARLGGRIAERLTRDEEPLRAFWKSATPVRHFVVDDLLDADEVAALARKMPPPSALTLKSSLRERKRVGVDVAHYDPSVGAHLFAFQDPRVVEAVTHITGLRGMHADPTLYASGISVMGRDDFLNPHLDNSHDGDQRDYRAINLLFYVSSGWREEFGGNLELWDTSVKQQRVVSSRCNRLVVMETNTRSWHSVQKVRVDAPRLCVSNYYFSRFSPEDREYRNVTSFRGRPEERWKRAALWMDRTALNAIGLLFPGLLTRNRHRLRGE
jgi:Rps23 Pro-64 3,4-dihydroxylase Tpa1-like proline 4-hydroxylase